MTSISLTKEFPLNEVTIGQATLYLADASEVLPHLSEIDACVTDPPYGLSFMGKAWDYDVPHSDLWRLVLNSLKAGAHLLSFSGSRTYHRLAVQVEDAGFDIRDQIMWIYGSGFPKSHDVSKAIDKTLGAKRDVVGIANALGFTELSRSKQTVNVTEFLKVSGEAVTPQANQWQGWGTALKPAHEPIVMARKPLTQSVARNVLKFGTGGLNIDGCRVGTSGAMKRSEQTPYGRNADGSEDRSKWARSGHSNIPIRAGRYPANVIHDGSEDVVSHFPNHAHSGSAARFFYCAKANNRDRNEGLDQAGANVHPTVKPTDLMAYLCRLVTPPSGAILDPFMGSGSTGKAALQGGFRFIGIERDPEYFDIACARLRAAQNL